MNGTTRIWAIACGAGTMAVLAGGWFLGVQPQLAAASTAADATTAAQAQNQATAIKLASLTKAAAKIDTLKAEDATLVKAVPGILKPNTDIRRINELAALDGVTVSSVTLGDSAAYTPPAAGDTGTLALGTADPAITAANFISIPTTVAVVGTADAVIQFAHDIQNDERTFAITSVQTTVDESNSGNTNGTFSGFIYAVKR